MSILVTKPSRFIRTLSRARNTSLGSPQNIIQRDLNLVTFSFKNRKGIPRTQIGPRRVHNYLKRYLLDTELLDKTINKLLESKTSDKLPVQLSTIRWRRALIEFILGKPVEKQPQDEELVNKARKLNDLPDFDSDIDWEKVVNFEKVIAVDLLTSAPDPKEVIAGAFNPFIFNVLRIIILQDKGNNTLKIHTLNILGTPQYGSRLTLEQRIALLALTVKKQQVIYLPRMPEEQRHLNLGEAARQYINALMGHQIIPSPQSFSRKKPKKKPN